MQALRALASPAGHGGNALMAQRRHKGHYTVPNQTVGMGWQQYSWLNRGRAVDKRNFFHARGHNRNKRYNYEMRRDSIGWGTLPHFHFSDVTDMRREIEERQGTPAKGTPTVLHKNAPFIVEDGFDFDKALAEPHRFAPKPGHYFSEGEQSHYWDAQEHTRLRGSPTKWQKKYYHGSFRLQSH
eukprot:TRINITY_DN7703_c0_g1_i1.p1 TRINITY_DN7703_c0_g1~~TRINITY_DN7703_c0_g1_i1.p1  ORF type:complete len:190 (+),score=8.55 TRINITY_DN7703_c0_g1_i1:23-571(+)